jgi:hypothetical protein
MKIFGKLSVIFAAVAMAVCSLASNSTCAADDGARAVMDKHADIAPL